MIRLLYIICNLSSLINERMPIVKSTFFSLLWKLKPDITCDSIYLILIINLDLLVLLQLVCHPPSQHEKHQSSCKNSDNVGYASYLFEQEKNKGYLPGEVRIYVTCKFHLNH